MKVEDIGAVRIALNKYGDDIPTLVTHFQSIGEYTSSKKAIIACAKLTEKYNAETTSTIITWLDGVARSTRSAVAVVESAKTVSQYGPRVAIQITERLWSVAERTYPASKSETTVLEFAKMFVHQDVYQALRKYKDNIAQEFAGALGMVAMDLKSTTRVVELAKIIRNEPIFNSVTRYNDEFVGHLIYKLHEIFIHTKSTKVYLETAKIVFKFDKELISEIMESLGWIAQLTGSEKAMLEVLQTLNDYEGNFADEIAKRLVRVAHEKWKVERPTYVHPSIANEVIKVALRLRKSSVFDNANPHSLSFDQYQRLIKKWPHITRYVSFQKVRLQQIKDIVKTYLQRKFFIAKEAEENGEYGFACFTKIDGKPVILSITVLRDKQYAVLNHIVITIYLRDHKELEDMMERLVIMLVNKLESVTNEKMMPPTHVEKKSVIIAIKDSVIYKSWIGSPEEVVRQIIDSIVSRSDL